MDSKGGFPRWLKVLPKVYVDGKLFSIKGAPADGRAMWTNGEVLALGPPPKKGSPGGIKVAYTDCTWILEQVEKAVQEGYELTTAKIRLGEDTVKPRPRSTHCECFTQDSEHMVTLDPYYLGYFKARYPGCRFYLGPGPDGPISPCPVVGPDGGLVGCIMPMRRSGDQGDTVKVRLAEPFQGPAPNTAPDRKTTEANQIPKSLVDGLKALRPDTPTGAETLNGWRLRLQTGLLEDLTVGEKSHLSDQIGPDWSSLPKTLVSTYLLDTLEPPDLPRIAYLEIRSTLPQENWSFRILYTKDSIAKFLSGINRMKRLGGLHLNGTPPTLTETEDTAQ